MFNIKHPFRYVSSFIKKPTSYNSYNGVKLDFNSSIVTPWIRDAIYKGYYESDECNLLKSYLEATDIVLEIGAGIGLTSAIVASKAMYSTHIEANPSLIHLVTTNISINTQNPCNHTVREAAVTAIETGDSLVSLHSGDNFWNAALKEREIHKNAINQKSVYIQNALKERQFNFLIMDVEGYELEIITSNKFPVGIKKIMIELHPKVIGDEGLATCVSLLELQGYKTIDKSGNSLYLTRAFG